MSVAPEAGSGALSSLLRAGVFGFLAVAWYFQLPVDLLNDTATTEIYTARAKKTAEQPMIARESSHGLWVP